MNTKIILENGLQLIMINCNSKLSVKDIKLMFNQKTNSIEDALCRQKFIGECDIFIIENTNIGLTHLIYVAKNLYGKNGYIDKNEENKIIEDFDFIIN
jgi:hypothetical protein